MQKIKFIVILYLITCSCVLQAQIIDKVIGVVGKYPILLSDLQNALLEKEKQDANFDKCKAFEMLVFQKLLVAQADRDSITVSDAEVDHELNQRMQYYIQQFGSEEKLEEFYGKRTNVIKDELRGDVQEQLIAQKMQGKIAGEVKLTPSEVRQFYNSIPEDSLPLINSEVELQQIVKKPKFSAEEKQIAKERLEEYRKQVFEKPEKMKTLAVLYSEDPGSASKGGLYENVGRGIMDPAFESVMFRLKQGEISDVFETAYGYHFIQLLRRKGELVDVRHILIVPKMSNADFYLSKLALDSIYEDIISGKITFNEAAKKYSDDAETKQNGGLMINRNTASTKFSNEDLSQIDPNLIATLNAMQTGEVSKPMQYLSPIDGKPGFRLLKLKNRIDPHKTNMKDDYQKLALLANADYNKKQVKEWIRKRSKITYIKLDPEYTCKFENQWIINN